jgi:hypothetical protein
MPEVAVGGAHIHYETHGAGPPVGNIRDLRLQLDAEPVEVVDDVAAGRSGGDDPLDSVDMEWVARGEIFWLLSRGQFVEEQRRISARVLR